VPDSQDQTALGVESFRGKCDECFGLCCVAPSFSTSADFAIDKEAGEPCPNLQSDFRCTIHDSLRPRGFAGCSAYDCLGAGQKVSQVAFGGRSWWDAPHTAEQMFETFRIVRQLQEMLFSLSGAAALPQGRSLQPRLAALYDEIDGVTRATADEIVATDVVAYRRQVNALLLRLAGELTRAGAGREITRRGIDLSGADLTGAYLRGADFTNANLRRTRLARADLRGADLTNTDLAGADLTHADLSGANLATCTHLTQSHLDTAIGDSATTIASRLTRPSHWHGH
jgi:uncharacterized protein YjbI with pentapeptide repeats